MTQKLLLLAGWAAIVVVTLWAVATLGLASAPATFASDVFHPWRAQFNLDLELQLLVFAAWAAWRERSLAVSLAAAAATLLLGALFTFPYLIFAFANSRGDVRRLLLGTRAA